MQRYEYLVVECEKHMVMKVNKVKVGTFGLSNKGEYVWDYLNQMGSEGWEVVAMGSDQLRTLILKRLIGQEAS
jgi:hypothetical protein